MARSSSSSTEDGVLGRVGNRFPCKSKGGDDSLFRSSIASELKSRAGIGLKYAALRLCKGCIGVLGDTLSGIGRFSTLFEAETDVSLLL